MASLSHSRFGVGFFNAMKDKQVIFLADRVRVVEKISDNSFKVEFYTGEYMRDQMIRLLSFPIDANLKITVEAEE